MKIVGEVNERVAQERRFVLGHFGAALGDRNNTERFRIYIAVGMVLVICLGVFALALIMGSFTVISVAWLYFTK